jgi:restriction system protein
MAVPDYQAFMLPLMRVLANGDSHRKSQIVGVAADALKVTEEDRAILLPSGKATIVRSRVGWALTYLKQAALVEMPSRGVYFKQWLRGWASGRRSRCRAVG